MNKPLIKFTTILIIIINFALFVSAKEVSVNIVNKREIKRLREVAFIPTETEGVLVLTRKNEIDTTKNETSFIYQISLNSIKKWEIKLPKKSSEFENIIKKNSTTNSSQNLNSPPKKRKKFTGDSENLTHYSRDYQMTPWTSTEPFFLEDSLPEKLLNWFYWDDSHAEFELTRHQMYNFSIDTNNSVINFMRPTLVDYTLNLSYTHNWKYLWFGAGFNRSKQISTYFDSLDTGADSWINRMGWNFHFAVPGFRYDIYRDPSVIPEYGRYDYKVFTNIVPNESHEILWTLDMDEKNSYDTILNPVDTIKGTYNGKDTTIIINDTLIVKYNLTRKRKPGHKFTVRVGHFRYSSSIDPDRYLGPIHKIMLKDMPFFKGSWQMGIFILPNGRTIPTGTVGFHTFHLPFGKSDQFAFDITPLKFTFQLTNQNEFYLSYAFKTEFFTNRKTLEEK